MRPAGICAGAALPLRGPVRAQRSANAGWSCDGRCRPWRSGRPEARQRTQAIEGPGAHIESCESRFERRLEMGTETFSYNGELWVSSTNRRSAAAFRRARSSTRSCRKIISAIRCPETPTQLPRGPLPVYLCIFGPSRPPASTPFHNCCSTSSKMALAPRMRTRWRNRAGLESDLRAATAAVFPWRQAHAR